MLLSVSGNPLTSARVCSITGGASSAATVAITASVAMTVSVSPIQRRMPKRYSSQSVIAER